MAEGKDKRKFIIKVGEAEVDLTDLPPLTLGDKKALKAQGVDFLKYARERNVEPEDESNLILYILRKRRVETTMAEVDNVPALIGARILEYFLHRATEVDDPFSTPSTSSPLPMGGENGKSSPEPMQS